MRPPLNADVRHPRRRLTLTVGALVVAAACGGNAARKPDITLVRHDNPAHGYVDPQPVGSYPSSEARINGWIGANQTDSIRAHAWDLWQSITAMVNDSTPVWQTFYSGYELFDTLVPPSNSRPRAARLPLERPRQFDHQRLRMRPAPRGRARATAGPVVDPAERVFGFNRYSGSTAHYIWDNEINRVGILYLTNLLMNAENTPTAQRELLVSKDSTDPLSFVTKTVFQFIRSDTVTAIPYWHGYSSANTRTDVEGDTLHPPPRYWKQAVAVDPTGKLQPGDSVFMPPNDSMPPAWLKVVPMSAFYYVKVTAADSANLTVFGVQGGGDFIGLDADTTPAAVRAAARPNNYGLLVAMHVTGKEIPNWTWQSYWWSPAPNDSLGNDRPASIPAPWNNYVMTTAYSMTAGGQPSGQPMVAFSPYLETSLFGYTEDSVQWRGVQTNCMSCHRRAAIGYWGDSAKNGFVIARYGPAAFVDPGDSSIFITTFPNNAPVPTPTLKNDFLWSVTIRAGLKPLTPSVRTAMRARADSILKARGKPPVKK